MFEVFKFDLIFEHEKVLIQNQSFDLGGKAWPSGDLINNGALLSRKISLVGKHKELQLGGMCRLLGDTWWCSELIDLYMYTCIVVLASWSRTIHISQLHFATAVDKLKEIGQSPEEYMAFARSPATNDYPQGKKKLKCLAKTILTVIYI